MLINKNGQLKNQRSFMLDILSICDKYKISISGYLWLVDRNNNMVYVDCIETEEDVPDTDEEFFEVL